MNPQNKASSTSTAAPSLNELKFKVTKPTEDLLNRVKSSITDVIDQSLSALDFSGKLQKLDTLDEINSKLDTLGELDGKIDGIRTMLQSVQQDISTIKDNYDQLKNALAAISWED